MIVLSRALALDSHPDPHPAAAQTQVHLVVLAQAQAQAQDHFSALLCLELLEATVRLLLLRLVALP